MRCARLAGKLALLLILLLACTPQNLKAKHTDLPLLTFAPGANGELLIISLSREPGTIQTFTLRNPDRNVVDITPARLHPKAPRQDTSAHPVVSGTRAGQFRPDTVRIVLDLKHPMPHLVASHPQVGEQTTFDVVILNPASQDEKTAALSDASSTPPPPPSPNSDSLNSSPTSPEATGGILLFGDSAPRAGHTPDASSRLPKTIDLGGFVELKTALDTKKDSEFEQTQMLRNRIRLEGKWTPDLAATPEHPAASPTSLFFLASVQSDYLWFGPESSTDDYDLELYEGYMHLSRNPWEVRLGRQRVRWGKTDGISPVDNVNPQDLREFMLPELEERKIPNWMARMRFFGDRLTVEGVAVPFFEPDRVAFFGTPWALFEPLQNHLHPVNQPSGYLPGIDENKPSRRLANGDWGVRLSRTHGNWDLAASYLYAWEKLPHVVGVPAMGTYPEGSLSAETLGTALRNARFAQAPIELEYRRSHILGLEFETTLDRFGLRGETAYFDRRSWLTERLVSTDKPVLHTVVGVDYLGEHDWYVNIQIGHQVIFDYDPEILFRDRHDVSVNGELSKEFWRGNLEAVLRYHYSITDQSLLFNPHLILRALRNWEFTLGADLISGSRDTILGQYRDNDQVYVVIKYLF